MCIRVHAEVLAVLAVLAGPNLLSHPSPPYPLGDDVHGFTHQSARSGIFIVLQEVPDQRVRGLDKTPDKTPSRLLDKTPGQDS